MHIIKKEAKLKRPHTIGFQLYDILEKTKVWRQYKDQWLLGMGQGEMKRQSIEDF